jgi:hypothetical protein
VANLIPLAFSLSLNPSAALVLLCSVDYRAMHGGRISSILLNIPGDEPALMTTLNGYSMPQQGRVGKALALPASPSPSAPSSRLGAGVPGATARQGGDAVRAGGMIPALPALRDLRARLRKTSQAGSRASSGAQIQWPPDSFSQSPACHL